MAKLESFNATKKNMSLMKDITALTRDIDSGVDI